MPVSLSDDRVWFDSNHKLPEICIQVSNSLAEGSNILLLSHFQSTLSTLEHLLRERGIAYQKFNAFDSNRLCSVASRTAWVGLARTFQSPNALSSQTAPTGRLQIVIAEHHPRQSKDQAVIDAAAKLGCVSEVSFYFSLDDALLKYFNGESVQKLFRRLGIDESECISHPLVTSAIRGAQEKIEDLVPKDLQAESIEDWFKYNLRR
jgi:preprotein translocase subunit SecA